MRLSSRERVVTNTFEWYHVQNGDFSIYFNFWENVGNEDTVIIIIAMTVGMIPCASV